MRKKIKILAHITGWLVLLAAIIVTFAFSYTETATVECSEIVIQYDEDQAVRLGRQEIIRLVNVADNQVIGKRFREINSEVIEREVEKHNTIEKADAFKLIIRDTTGYRGVLSIKVKYRDPLLRVISSQGSFYLDKYGHRFPTSIYYSSNVLVASGNVSEDFAREQLLPLAGFIAEDDFWKAQIRQVHVNGHEELVLTPLVGDQLIEFGSAGDFREKFRNLMAFYEQVLSNSNWNKYERISVKYKNQVIGKKSD